MKRWDTRATSMVIAAVVCILAGLAWRGRTDSPDSSQSAVVRRGSITAQLTTAGTLKPVQSITYRSPVAGRELEITELVAEGTPLGEGDLIARLDTTDLQRDLERARQEARQSRFDVQVAEFEREEAAAAVTSVSEGEGALTVEEARTHLQIAQKRVDRLRREYQLLLPLLDKGVITREELKKSGDELEQSEQELALAKRRANVLTELAHPRDRQRAALQLAQKTSQLENVRTKAVEADTRLKTLNGLIESCSLYARRPGIVVYEEFLNATPRRKIRVGDRVTSSQGIVTIPEVNRMTLEASVSEAEVHRVRPGQQAAIRVEAFPDARLTGTVMRVGTLARASADRPFDDRRFDVIFEVAPSAIDLRPEMTARADIVVGTRSDVLLVPVNAVFEERGVMVAHVVNRAGIRTLPVALGESDDAMVEIVSGLSEGDRVLLTTPRSSGNAAAPATAPSSGVPRASRMPNAAHLPQRR
jgi:HlyD family secretion protein